MYQSWSTFHGLYQVGLYGIFQQDGHRSLGVDITCIYRRQVTTMTDNYISQAILQVIEIGRQTKYRHDFRGYRNIETIGSWKTVGYRAQTIGNFP